MAHSAIPASLFVIPAFFCHSGESRNLSSSCDLGIPYEIPAFQSVQKPIAFLQVGKQRSVIPAQAAQAVTVIARRFDPGPGLALNLGDQQLLSPAASGAATAPAAPLSTPSTPSTKSTPSKAGIPHGKRALRAPSREWRSGAREWRREDAYWDMF